MKGILRMLIAAALAGVPTWVSAAEADGAGPLFRSGPERVPLLELYTSEGCSSSVAGDRWFSSLTAKKGLWTQFVPIAFHVDYWDYLGWEDRFAAPAHSERQRAYSRHWEASKVYTPGIILGGDEWRRWRWSRKVPKAGTIVGNLAAEVLPGPSVRVTFVPVPGSEGPWQAEAALLGFGLSTEVSAGENAGRRLTHDFAVLGMSRSVMEKTGDSFTRTLRLDGRSSSAPRYGIAVWISRPDDPTPVQATGGYLR